MSQTLTIPNYSSRNVLETTTLTADANAAQANLSVENASNFATNTIAVVGTIGSETLEKFVVQGVASLVLTATANLAINHKRFDPITKLYGDRIRIYRADNVDGSQPDDADFTLLTPVNIDFDDIQTRYEDADGSSDYWYKSTYYNSIADTETPLSDSTAVRGGGYGNYASLESIRSTAGFANNRFITDAKIDEKRQAAQNLINATLTGIYTIPFTNPINPLIAEITRKLAAGYLLSQEATNAAMRAQGEALIAEVTNADGTGTLDKLDKKELKLVGILGADGSDSSTSVAGTVSGWPNETTADADGDVGGAPRQFRMSDRY